MQSILTFYVALFALIVMAVSVILARALRREKRSRICADALLAQAKREAGYFQELSTEATLRANSEREKAVRTEMRARERAIRAAALASWVFELHQRQILVYIPGVGVALAMKPVHGNVVEICSRAFCNRDAKLLKGAPPIDDNSISIQRCPFQVVHFVVPRMGNRNIYALLVDESGTEPFAREIDTLSARGELCPHVAIHPVIDHGVRRLCARPYHGHPKGCPNLRKSPRCPPNVMFFERVFDMSGPFWVIYSTFDLGAHKARMRQAHPEWSERQLVNVYYWQGTARARLRQEIARFKEAHPERYWRIERTPEAFGCNVTATMKAAGIELEWPPTKICTHVAIAGAPR